MRIKNKLESANKIKELGLNTLPEELFRKGQEHAVESFMNKWDAQYFSIRNKEVVGFRAGIGLTREEVLEEIKDYNFFSVMVAPCNYADDLILAGDIRIDKKNQVWLTASKIEYIKFLKEAPEYNFCTDIFDRKLGDIPGFDIILKYIMDHNLIDVIIEFEVHEKPMGIKNEQVAIMEIRTDY